MKHVIENFLQSRVDIGDFPGGGFALINSYGIIDSGYVGFKSLEPEKIPNVGNEIYDVASLTKVVSTTSLVLKLIEQNLMELDTCVTKILPRFKHTKITVFDLMTHSSGLPADIRNAKELKNSEQVENIIYEMDLIYPTGERIVYSDVGFILLGWMIEKITHTPLDQYAQNVLFEPLGMKDTGYHPDSERCAPTEQRIDGVFQGFLKGRVHDEKAFALQGVSGHAGLFSTPKDIGLFIHAILTEDKRLFNHSTYGLLYEPQKDITDVSGNRIVRALGWDKPLSGGTAGNDVDFINTIAHTGFTGCNIWIDKARKLGFVLLSNGVHPKRELNKVPLFRNKLANLILANKGD